jgi:hypothetical protein
MLCPFVQTFTRVCFHLIMASVDMNHSLYETQKQVVRKILDSSVNHIASLSSPFAIIISHASMNSSWLRTCHIFFIVSATQRKRESCVILRMFLVIMKYVGVLQIKNVFGHLADGHWSEAFKVTLSSTVPPLFSFRFNYYHFVSRLRWLIFIGNYLPSSHFSYNLLRKEQRLIRSLLFFSFKGWGETESTSYVGH